MLVLILLIIAATVFGLLGLYGIGYPQARDWRGGAAALGWCVLAIALAIWHGNG